MRTLLVISMLAVSLMGCVEGPVISKSVLGSLEINVYGPEGIVNNAELYLDGLFVGNLTKRLPVIHAKRGGRTVRVVAPGFKPYEKTITILGEPNHQVLNIFLEKEQ